MSFHRTAEGPESCTALNLLSVSLSVCWSVGAAMRQKCLGSALIVFPPLVHFISLERGCGRRGVLGARGGGGVGVQLMGSITFLLSPVGRHGDRGGDLHRQRD